MIVPRSAPTPLLVLHGVRLLGFGSDAAVAHRFALEPAATTELLEDAEAFGWVRRSASGSATGWSLTDAGRARNEALLAEELDGLGVRSRVEAVHVGFLPLNARLLDACTRWQLRPLPGDPLAANDHTDHAWDDRVLGSLASVGHALAPLAERLTGALPRCAGYHARYAAALAKAQRGESSWVDGVGIDSCHRVWIELHEDLIATLGLSRG
ncbi:MAG TPA: hypothetical protein VFL59_10250 [Candidatus Nanopelagicales bacterium]|nr:hypothetical protein [Candidatus Nanopelagicales bacterium]